MKKISLLAVVFLSSLVSPVVLAMEPVQQFYYQPQYQLQTAQMMDSADSIGSSNVSISDLKLSPAIKKFVLNNPEVVQQVASEVEPEMTAEEVKKLIEEKMKEYDEKKKAEEKDKKDMEEVKAHDMPVPAPVKSDFSLGTFLSEYWVQFWALLISVISVIIAVTGFSFANKKKQKSTSKYLVQIDDVFSSFKTKSKRCEAELYRIQDMIEDELKSGKIDEHVYNLLSKRIEKYLGEVKEGE